MAEQWYFRNKENVVGPVSLVELEKAAKAGQINDETLVRSEENPEWFPARRVSDLFQVDNSSTDSTLASDEQVEDWLGTSKIIAVANAGRVDTPGRDTADSKIVKTKTCPYCAEEIALAARKCKHCGEYVEGAESQPETKSSTRTAANSERMIWEGHPATSHYLMHWMTGIILLPLFCFALIDSTLIIVFTPFSVFGLLLMLFAFLDRKTRSYRVTNQRVTSKRGIIMQTTDEVALEDVRSIHLHRDLVERVQFKLVLLVRQDWKSHLQVSQIPTAFLTIYVGQKASCHQSDLFGTVPSWTSPTRFVAD